MKSIEKFKLLGKTSLNSLKKNKSEEELTKSPLFPKIKNQKQFFEKAKSENFRYRQKDDLSDYLDEHFPDKKADISLEIIKENQIIHIENQQKIKENNFFSIEKPPLSEEKNPEKTIKQKNQKSFKGNIKKKNVSSVSISKESSIKQIEIEANPDRIILANNEGDQPPRLSEEEIKKYIIKLYLSINFQALAIFLMFLYISLVFIYEFPVVSLIYVNVAGEIYKIIVEMNKWRNDATMFIFPIIICF